LKKIIPLFLLNFLPVILCAQKKVRDSLEIVLASQKTDSGRIYLLEYIGTEFSYSSPDKDSATWYYQKALDLAKKTNDTKTEIQIQVFIAENFFYAGNFPQALSTTLHFIKTAEVYKDTADLFYLYRLAVWVYNDMSDDKTALEYVRKMDQLVRSGFYKDSLYQMPFQISNASYAMVYSGLNHLDSALYYQSLVYKYAVAAKDEQALVLSPHWIGETYSKMGRADSAFYYFRLAMSNAMHSSRKDIIPACKFGIAELYLNKNQTDSAFYYVRQAQAEFINNGDYASLMDVYELLSILYKKTGRYDSAFLYQQRYIERKDSLFNQKKISEVQNMAFNETLQDQQLSQAKKEAQLQYQNKIKIYILVGILSAIMIIAFLLMRNLQTKKRANGLLQKQKEEIEEQRNNVEKALVELKLTQNQLIQSEKMASLGEITSGIAHEIQNPLNFVNNFSSVNKELLEEMKDEIKKGNMNEVNSIAEDLILNEEKINLHGKRADAIVKSMMLHSRTSAGKKEATNINDLAAEYFKLAYRAFKSRDNSFNVIIQSNLDPAIGTINIVPQDFGRVLLNLYNNAFYAVSEKSKRSDKSYAPTITLTTEKNNHQITIKVRDNGHGINEKDMDKIFQPFFTTKPAGQGTGLGLSLSYDIIKAHGGQLKVHSVQGDFAEFIIDLPLNPV
jgi:two-component system, NtrC family, sensor kinase